IDLRDASRHERLPRQPPAGVLLREPAFHVLTERERMAPWNRRFERFRDDVVAHQEIADIGDAVRELIAAAPILSSGFHAAVTGGDTIELPFLLLYFVARPFEDQRARDHLGWFESFDLRDEK